MSVVVSELHFFQVKGEQGFRDAMMFDQPFLGIGPEAFKAVDVDLARAEAPLMIDLQMAIAAEHQCIVAAEFIGINDAAASHHLDCHIQENLGRDLSNDLDFDQPLTLENAENRDFAGRPASTMAFASAAEVGLIGLDLPTQEEHTILAGGGNAFPYQVESLEDRGIGKSDLTGCFMGRQFELEKFDDPEPIPGRYSELADPPAAPVIELIPAVLTAIFLAPDLIDFSTVTLRAETMPTMPADSGDILPGSNF
jgi:hypothetical protein